jgi:UAA transporter family
MQYINYPAKTLMKSSRVVFTMMFGVLIQRKKYKPADYAIVVAMVLGLATFMHADASSSAVFHHMGVVMLTISLFCDGAISNVSETIMNQFGVGQDEVCCCFASKIYQPVRVSLVDSTRQHIISHNRNSLVLLLLFLFNIGGQFIFRLYSISLMAISAAAAVKGDFSAGMIWMLQPGTYQQFLDNVPMEERTWSVTNKFLVMILFSSMGFFGSSCSAAITKNFGALTMSITSTARKATTLFLSFFLFNNVCTYEHIAGIALFITALTAKSLRRRHHTHSKKKKKYRSRRQKPAGAELPVTIAMPTTDSTPERLTFRHHRASSNDGVDAISRANPAHVV